MIMTILSVEHSFLYPVVVVVVVVGILSLHPIEMDILYSFV